MTQTESRHPSSHARSGADRGAYSLNDGAGWLWFAAVMIFLAGCHNLIYGISTLRDYAVVVNNLSTGEVNVIYADTTFWGWMWIGFGIAQIIAAFALPSRNQAVRWFAVALATVNAIGQLAFLAAFPVWSIIIIAIDVLIVYGLLTWDSPIRSAYSPYPDDASRAESTDRPWEGGYRASAGGPTGSGAEGGTQPAARSGTAPGATAGPPPGSGPRTP